MTFTARNSAIGLAVVLAAVASAARAAEERAFEAKAFLAAQAQGRTIVVAVHADWCPTCKAQRPILDKLSHEPGFAGFERFRVDFDAQKDAVRRFKAPMQSTLVVFKGSKEVGRSVGETAEPGLRALLEKGR